MNMLLLAIALVALPVASIVLVGSVAGGAHAQTLTAELVPPRLLTVPATITDNRQSATKAWVVSCTYTGRLYLSLVGAPAGATVPGIPPTCPGASRAVAVRYNTGGPGTFTWLVNYHQTIGGPIVAYTVMTVTVP